VELDYDIGRRILSIGRVRFKERGAVETKKLSEITKKEWVRFNWSEIDIADGERIFAKGFQRTPDEAMSAMMAWDETEEYFSDDDVKESEGE
jgi:hypothetical protein